MVEFVLAAFSSGNSEGTGSVAMYWYINYKGNHWHLISFMAIPTS